MREFLEAETLQIILFIFHCHLKMSSWEIVCSMQTYFIKLFVGTKCLFLTIHKMPESRNKKYSFSSLLAFENVMQIVVCCILAQSVS